MQTWLFKVQPGVRVQQHFWVMLLSYVVVVCVA